MSDTPQGPGWWQASDLKWYPPEQQPGAAPGMPYTHTQHGYGYSYGPGFAYSGFWRRAGAYFIDGLILSVPTRLIPLAASAGSGGGAFGAGLAPGASGAVSPSNIGVRVGDSRSFDGTRAWTCAR